MESDDYQLALRLQLEADAELWHADVGVGSSDVAKCNAKASESTRLSQQAAEMELLDPSPDIHALFVSLDGEYFSNALGSVEVKWSQRMTRCAGLCCYEGRGGLCVIKLSQPLLVYRERRELLETLLHEMIHAYLFVTQNNRDRDGHGPEFQKHMHRINGKTGLNITIYHSFHDEVAHYQRHWWRCDGPCARSAPFFGYCKRSMNRPPGPNDHWWKQHQLSCGGAFVKVKSPHDFPDYRAPSKTHSKSRGQPKSALTQASLSCAPLSASSAPAKAESRSQGSSQSQWQLRTVGSSGSARQLTLLEMLQVRADRLSGPKN